MRLPCLARLILRRFYPEIALPTRFPASFPASRCLSQFGFIVLEHEISSSLPRSVRRSDSRFDSVLSRSRTRAWRHPLTHSIFDYLKQALH